MTADSLPSGSPPAGPPLLSSATTANSAGTLPADVGYDRTARRILEAATEQFGTRGVHGSSMRDIAAAAGIRAPSIYEHFGSKDAIVTELMQIGYRCCVSTFDRHVAAVGEDPLARLDAAVDALVEVHTTHPLLMRVLTDDVFGLPPAVTAPALTARLEMSLRVAQILIEGEAAGVMSFPNIASTVAAVHGLFIRIPHWYSPDENYEVDELTADYRVLVRSMLGAD